MKVQKRPETFEAIQVDLGTEGLCALQEFLRGPVHTTYPRGFSTPHLMLDGGVVANQGDWIVREQFNDLRVLSSSEFAARFMPAEPA